MRFGVFRNRSEDKEFLNNEVRMATELINAPKIILSTLFMAGGLVYTQKNWKFHFTVGFKRKS